MPPRSASSSGARFTKNVPLAEMKAETSTNEVSPIRNLNFNPARVKTAAKFLSAGQQQIPFTDDSFERTIPF